jgi:cytochrome c oxidase assembly protein subunit 15
MRAPRLSPAAFRRLTLVNVVALMTIIVSGAIVRLTNSGLGCDDWPNCNATKLVDVSGSHAAIEQLNRIFSGAIGIPIGLALLGAYWRAPRRDDLVRLGWLLFALFWAEAVLGGISVLVKLAWVSVMGHFLLAIALVGVALTMYRRAGATPARSTLPPVSRRVLRLADAVYALTMWVLVAGTLVTAAGPHGGDEHARRLGWSLPQLARIHAVSVDVLVAVVVVLVVVLVRTRAPRSAVVAGWCTLAAMTAQGVLGYVQYFRQIPPLLVGFHVFGAVVVFVCVQQVWFELRPAPGPALGPAVPAAPDRPRQAAVVAGR